MASAPLLIRGDVVAAIATPSPWLRDLVASCWEAGAAVLPVDPRLAPAELDGLIERARPTVVAEGGGWTRRSGGVAAAEGSAVIVASSGSAGEPRLVEIGRQAVEAAVTGSFAMLGARAEDGWLCCLPVAHIGGLLVVLRSVLMGAPLVTHRRFEVADVAVEIDRGLVAYTSVVPTMVTRLLDGGVDLSSLRGILIGGAGVDGELRASWHEGVPGGVLTYGSTQTCGGVVYDGDPLPGVRVRISGRGEIEMAGSTLMSGYRLDPSATATALTSDGWLRTGDAGRLSAAGLLEVEGRLDDLIITGGEKVWPDEVEAAVRPAPGVGDVAVAGRPDREWGMRVVAFVVPADPATPPTREQVREFVAGRIARFKSPMELVIVPSLPRTALGKVRRSALPGSETG